MPYTSFQLALVETLCKKLQLEWFALSQRGLARCPNTYISAYKHIVHVASLSHDQ